VNFDALASPIFGQSDSLRDFLFENAIQHQNFADRLAQQDLVVQRYPLTDVDPEQLDDWLQVHQIEHQQIATYLNLNNPFNLLDTDWNQEDDFYDWIQQHLLIHENIARALGV
jgi:hypothetical protein